MSGSNINVSIKRSLGLLVFTAIIVVFICLIMTAKLAYAADKIASGVCGDNLTWTIDEDYVLTINGTGDMYNYGQTSSTGGPAPWNGYVNSIIKVEISEGVTSIGSFAFYNCRGAYSINIPSTVSNFGRYSFYNCSGISKINIPVNLESLGVGTFRGCTGLTSAVVPSGITIIPVQAFSECGIRSVTLPNSIKEIDESAFSACGNLQSIALPEGLEIIGENAFTGAGLTTLEIPSTVRTIGKGVCKSKSLSAIHVNDENDYYKDVDGVLLSKDGKTLILFPYQKGGYSVDYSIPDGVEIIESDAFHYGMESSQPNMNTTGYPMNINSITVPEGITSLESYSLYCFIENLYLPQSLKKLKMYSVARANNVYLKTCMAPMAHATAFYSGITNVHAPESSIGYDVNPWASGTVVYDMPSAHIWNEEYTTDKAATCKEEGSKSIHCSVCDSVDESTVTVIPKSDHTYGDWTVTKEATCTEDGSKEKVCSVCEDKVTEVIPATGHQWNEEYTVDKEATCTEEGSESIHCSVCDAIQEGSSRAIDKKAHTYGEWTVTKEATCTEAGEEKRICNRCEEEETREVAALGHTEEVMAAVSATCTEPGLTEGKKCSVCGEILVAQETVAALGHDYHEVEGSAVAATCTTAGKHADQKCSRCDSVIEGEAIEALGHDWGEWTVVKEATEDEEGLEVRICCRDASHTEERVIPKLDHVHDLVKTDAVVATCTVDGNIEYWTCSKCGRIYSDSGATIEIDKKDTVIKASGHTEEVMAAVSPTCTETGLTEGKKCSACGEILVAQETVAALGHDYHEVEGTAVSATCTIAGKHADQKCSRCDSVIEGEAIAALGHNWDEGTVTQQPTTTVPGIMTYTCTVCGEIRTEEIPVITKTGWIKENGSWYYYSADGTAVTGWQKISSKWYYFNASGVMQTGWVKLSGKWYYFNSSGAMLTGWQKISGKQYFFKSSGAMAANEWVKGYYWLNKDGTWTYKYKASWKKSGSKWWFGDTSGWYAKNTTITIDGKKYTFDKKGYMV